MPKHLSTLGVVLMVVLGLCVLTGWLSSAEAVIIVRSASVQNGVAVVDGGNAARNARIYWEDSLVTQANNGGNFTFQGSVPAECVGSLHEGDPAAAMTVALANCEPVSEPPAPVPQTGQAQCWDPTATTSPVLIPCEEAGQDGDLQAGIPFPSPRFTERGDSTVRDHLTGLIWLKNANCFILPQLWADALQLVKTVASGTCGLSDGSAPGDWRLPHIKELESLVDLRFLGPSLSNAAGTRQWTSGDPFTGVVSGKYWSSTSVATNPTRAWTVDLSGHYTVEERKDEFGASPLWPVRGPE
jgi:hypothetical protein